jgi:hypothetical protein
MTPVGTKAFFMRFLIIFVVTLGAATGFAFAEVAPAPPAALRLLESRKVISARETHAAAVADCERMWDRGTHMTKQDWSRTCRRVQNRLQHLQVN